MTQKLITAPTLEAFDAKVNEHMVDGWNAVSGTLTYCREERRWVIVLEKEETPTP